MASLHDTIGAADPAKRAALISDCLRLVDDEVASKRGMSGLAVKAGFKVVKSVKPGFIRVVVDALFDDFVAEVEPFWTAFEGGGAGRFGDYLTARPREVASALLGVTDKRAARAQTKSVKKAYQQLRPRAQDHVEAAVPGMAKVLDRHVG